MTRKNDLRQQPALTLSKRNTTREAPNSVSKNNINFRYQNEPKTSPLYLLVLGHDNLFLSVLLMKDARVSKVYNRGASRLGEAWVRPRLGRKTSCIGTRTKRGFTRTRNKTNLLLKSQQVELEVVGNCAVLPEF